jgi:hypothetical protein
MSAPRYRSLLAPLVVVGVGLALPATSAPVPGARETDPYPHPRGYVCYRAAGPITIDGDPKEPSWAAVPWSEPFGDIEGDTKPRPTYLTRVKMLWDDEALYIAAELAEPHVWGTLKEHDCVIFQDNDFEVFLDPDGDTHVYGELELNALNTTWDLLLTKPYRDGGRAVHAWEIVGLKTAVKINGTLNDPSNTDKGWTIEIKWPWKGLEELVNQKVTPVPPVNGDQWRINFSRVEWDTEVVNGKYHKIDNRPEHNWVWSPQGAIDMHRPERWGYLQFSTAKPGEAKFRPDPDWDLRSALHRAYYAQQLHRTKTGKYATTAADLGLKLPADGLRIETTRNSYEMWWPDEKGEKPRYTITSDGRISR